MSRVRSGVMPLTIDWGGIGAASLGFVATVAVAASRGGYFPESWAWLALLTLVPAAVLVIATHPIHLGRLDFALLGLLLAYGSWVLLSATWSVSVTRSVLEAQRTLAYLGLALLALLVVRRRTAPLLVAGALAGVTVVAGYAFLTRALPDRFTRFDSLAGYRLTDPIGYWNGLGIFAAMGALLALGFAARARGSLMRGIASALPVVLLATVFFTFSRGAWVALAAGLAVAVIVDPRRLQLLATLLALAPWSALGVWLCWRSDALTTVGSSLSQATSEGRSLLVYIAGLSLVSGLVGFGVAEVSRRVDVGVTPRRAFTAVLVVAALAALGGLWVEAGSPVSAATSAWDRFKAPNKVATSNLTDRLFDLSSTGRVDLWSTSADDFAAHPLRGTGAGTFSYSWAVRRDSPSIARDGHSLYMETLGELGIVGLALIVGVLVVPLVAAMRARHSSVLPGGVAAFAAYAVHAGVDWDWELTGVTLVAILSAVGLVAAARSEAESSTRGRVAFVLVPLTVVLAALAFVTALGNVPLGRARDALDGSRYAVAQAEARRARTWAPWSSEPLQILGEAQLNTGSLRVARATLLEAIDKDPDDWELWVDLALVSEGAERKAAVKRASRLNPLSTEVQQLLAVA